MVKNMVRLKDAEICGSTDSKIAAVDLVNNLENDEGTQNIELNSTTFSKDTVELAYEEVPRWSSDEFNPVGVLVKNW